MNIIAPWGTCIVARDEMIDSVEYSSGVKLYIPDETRKLASTGKVLLHSSLMEENFAGKRIVFDKYAGRSWRVGSTTFWTVPERAVLAVFDGE